MCLACVYVLAPSGYRLAPNSRLPYEKQDFGNVCPPHVDPDHWRWRHQTACIVMGAVTAGLDAGFATLLFYIHWDQAVQVWAIAALASLLESVYIIVANFSVECNACPASHYDLDDSLPWIFSLTFGVQLVFFIGVWIESITKPDSYGQDASWEVAIMTGIWVIVQMIGLAYVLIAKIKSMLLLGEEANGDQVLAVEHEQEEQEKALAESPNYLVQKPMMVQ
ncbi:hypothetical protein T439DRAFT_354341 [Meredithblackwellia eburnea MCA 4105]